MNNFIFVIENWVVGGLDLNFFFYFVELIKFVVLWFVFFEVVLKLGVFFWVNVLCVIKYFVMVVNNFIEVVVKCIKKIVVCVLDNIIGVKFDNSLGII